nr:1-(5-phosphoribosyl)-5-[(5-phosphoribosylamino)methylideneamino]imidazole-4-carboxamide isomerase [Ardenticatena sp.]
MDIFPAIDIRHGRCVRLLKGDPNAETVYGNDPVAMAERWVREGAEWLHVVNLDGAFGEATETVDAVKAIVRAVDIPVQFGGGLRTFDDIAEALDWGVARVVLGTVAVTNPDLVSRAIDTFGAARIVVGIDARDRTVATHGWQQETGLDIIALVMRMKQRGVERIIYTDITRDGTLQGPNVARTGELAHLSKLRVIASGGIGSLDHIRQIRWIEPYGVEGVIVGKALYEGAFSLRDALAIARAAPGETTSSAERTSEG